MAERPSIVDKVQEIAERVAASRNLEIVEVQMLGGGAHRVLRIFIDRLPGTTPPIEEIAPIEAAESDEVEAAVDEDNLPPDGQTGVTLGDCEYVSHQVGTILDVEEVIPGGKYSLEVSSPGVERKLRHARDFSRFVGQKVKVTLREPVDGQKSWTGLLSAFEEDTVTLEAKPGKTVSFPLTLVDKANLKFEWK